MRLAIGGLAGLLLVASCAWVSLAIGARLVAAGAGAAVRACASAIVACWLLVVAFLALSAAHAFRLEVAAPLWALAALVAHRSLAPARRKDALSLAGDARRVQEALRDAVRGPLRWVLVPAAFLAVAKLLRGLVAPPLGWDALTYHLVKAGRWVQESGRAPFHAPDAWRYYEHFAPHGDVLWAWAMLPVRGDALLAPAGFAVWLACGLGAYTAARALDAGRRAAALTALAIAFTPAVFNAMTISYVDNTLLALFLLGAPFVVRFLAAPRAADALVASAAFGLAAGVKPNALPLLAIWGVTLVARTLRRDVTPRARLAALAGSAMAAGLVALPPYIETWVRTGSPIYPVPLAIGGRALFAGNAEFVALETGALLPEERFSMARVVHALIVSRLGMGRHHAGIAPGALVLLALGLAAAWRARREGGRRAAVFFLVASGAAFVAAVASPSVRSLWTAWAYSSPRLVVPCLAALAIAGATLSSRTASAARWLAVASALPLCLPLWSRLDFEASARLAPWILAALAAGALVVRATRRRPRRIAPRAAAALVIATALLLPLDSVRRAVRYRYYEAAADGAALDLYPLARPYVAPWPIWRHFDDGSPHSLAVTAGWDGMGHNWYLYPLLGSLLQNRICYVTPTRDGSVIDYREEERIATRSSLVAWLGLLFESGADFVVALPPPAIEAAWMMGMPNVFEPVASGAASAQPQPAETEAGMGGRAYRFQAEEAAAILYGTR